MREKGENKKNIKNEIEKKKPMGEKIIKISYANLRYFNYIYTYAKYIEKKEKNKKVTFETKINLLLF